MKNIIEIKQTLKKEFTNCISEGYDIENAKELAMGQLSDEEIEEHGTIINQTLTLLELLNTYNLLQAV